MQSNIFGILALGSAFITISCGTTFTFTFDSNNQVTSDIICPQGQDCVVECLAPYACYGASGPSDFTLHGPSGRSLTINVNSNLQSVALARTFQMKIQCTSCQSLNINAPGIGQFEMWSTYIYTPSNGLTTVNCGGPATVYACGPFIFYGAAGYGTGKGQVNVIDVSNTPGRIDKTIITYVCTGRIRGDCIGGSGRNYWDPNGYLDCERLTCSLSQSSIDPEPVGKTVAGSNPLGGPLNGDLPPGFVNVPEGDYFVMRGCMIIVVIGVCVCIIRTIMKLMTNCDHRKRIHSYSKVKYNTDTEISA